MAAKLVYEIDDLPLNSIKLRGGNMPRAKQTVNDRVPTISRNLRVEHN